MVNLSNILHNITHKHVTMTHDRLPDVTFGLCSLRLLPSGVTLTIAVYGEVNRSFFLGQVQEHQVPYLLNMSEALTGAKNVINLVTRLRDLGAHEHELEVDVDANDGS